MLKKYSLPIHLSFDGLESAHAAYLERGDGTPLLMLHGFMGDAGCWLPLMDQLSNAKGAALQAHHYHCIGLDLLGFGDSTKPMIQYTVAKEVEFVRRAVEALQLESFYLLGHSFGGWVASAYAVRHPEMVKGLILAAPAGIRDDSFAGRYDHLRPLLWQTPLIDWALHVVTPIARAFGQEKPLAQIAWFRQQLNAQPAARSFLVDRLRPEDAIDTVEKDIHRIAVPTLVITGDQDDTIPLWHSQTYAQRIPQAELVILPGASHALPQNHAPELASLIRQRVVIG
ncbi:alpha/beta fold hydrolase [Myxacorys almedinensis]|uniref:Alpha/beta fold hydrolase n=1 Tax=Myxacorys almedinensis A TaxID=2690445 RepID=A0A8J7Z344_9CYAN|nr:alpha/beta hydrolase [Myxacorys almedinensis]NDJ18400.1 alpha/beta fold hydrolase [Myxacorys almedinensis A]